MKIQFPTFNKLFLLPALSGVLLALTLPPFNVSIFLWIAFIPLFLFIDNYGLNLKQIFWGGFLFGFVYAVKLTYPLYSLNAGWWGNIISIVYNNSKNYYFFILILIIILYSFLFAVFSILYKKYKKNNLFDILIFPSLWILLEFIRSYVLLDINWGHIGFALHDNTYILQLARIFKLYGLSFFIILINLLIYNIFLELLKNKYTFKQNGKIVSLYKNIKLITKNYSFYILILFFSTSYLYGYLAVKNQQRKQNDTNYLVSIIQPGEKSENVNTEFYFNNYRKMIKETLLFKPDILILPVNAFPFLILRQNNLLPINYNTNQDIKKVYDDLINISKNYYETSFMIGFLTQNNGQTYNSATVLENGKFTGLYSKRKLLPLSESPIRFLNIYPIEQFGEGARNQEVFIKNKLITPLICSEILSQELPNNKKAEFIINIGNDSGFSNSTVAEQNHIIAKIRAVENNKYVLRAMKTEMSSIINPVGIEIYKLKNGSGIIINNISY